MAYKVGQNKRRLNAQFDGNNSDIETGNRKGTKSANFGRRKSFTAFGAFALCVIALALIIFFRSPHSSEVGAALDRSTREGVLNAGVGGMTSQYGMSFCVNVNETEIDMKAEFKDASKSSNSYVHNNMKRFELYNSMVNQTRKNGLVALNGSGEKSTQSLSNDKLFTRGHVTGFDRSESSSSNLDNGNGNIRPNKIPLDVPVRAVVIPFKGGASGSDNNHNINGIHRILQEFLLPLYNKDQNNIWLQDFRIYHASIFHTSHHLSPVSKVEGLIGVDDLDSLANHEYEELKKIFSVACPFKLSLDRIMVTSGGAILALWKVLIIEGYQHDNSQRAPKPVDVADIRSSLRTAFPYAPQNQMSTEIIIHTTLARIIGPLEDSNGNNLDANKTLVILEDTCKSMMQSLCGRTFISIESFWFVEEFDLLALALEGRYRARELPLHCNASP